MKIGQILKSQLLLPNSPVKELRCIVYKAQWRKVKLTLEDSKAHWRNYVRDMHSQGKIMKEIKYDQQRATCNV